MTASNGRIYKIDRRSGKMWLVYGNKETPISPDVNENKKSPTQVKQELEEGAIKFVKGQNSISPYKDNESCIKEYLQNRRGELNIKGWKAKTNLEDKTFLISFIWEDNEGKHGYFFEFSIEAQILRLVNGDIALEEKYGVENLAFHRTSIPIPN